jgi:hypothetical protein
MEQDYKRKENYYRHGIIGVASAFIMAFDSQRFPYSIYLMASLTKRRVAVRLVFWR